MPQPLSRVDPTAAYKFADIGWSPFERNAKLAQLAINGIASWSNVEFFMLKLYLSLAGGAKSDAAAVFLALESNSTKTSAIAALLERRLAEPHKNLYRAIARLVKTRAKARDRLAHWIWGSSDKLPDALLLANPRDVASMPFPHLRPHILVYRENDFQAIIADNEELAGYGFDFNALILGRCNPNELYQWLCDEPPIRAILDRQGERDQSLQEG